jgi:tetratricopeptide (TPR) repeat protein
MKAGIVSYGAKIKNSPKLLAVLGVTLVVAFAVLGLALINNSTTTPKGTKLEQANQYALMANQALKKGNETEALMDDKKALAIEPNNVGNIMLVANLTEKENPELAKQYYTQAFDKYNQQNNLASPKMTAVNYWGAANLAEQAGEISQAKQYYQQVIKTANPANSYEQELAQKSQAQIEKLQ